MLAFVKFAPNVKMSNLYEYISNSPIQFNSIQFFHIFCQQMSFNKFQTDSQSEFFQQDKDPNSLAISKKGLAKLDVLKNPHVNSIVFLHDGKIKQMFQPRELMVEDGTVVVAGWIGEDPEVAVPATMVRDDFAHVFPTYCTESTQSLFIGLQGGADVPTTHFDGCVTKPSGPVRATYLSLWFPKYNGIYLSTPVPHSDWDSMEQEFAEMECPQFPEGLYHAHEITLGRLQTPSRNDLPARKPQESTLATTPSMALRLISQDDLGWFGHANMDVLKEIRNKFRITQIPSSTPQVPLGSAPSATPTGADLAILNMAKKVTDANDKIVKQMQTTGTSKSTLAKSQSIIRWRLVQCKVTPTGLDLRPIQPSFRELLDESKQSRMSAMRDVMSAKTRDVKDARAHLYKEIFLPPTNLTTTGLVFECEFCGTVGDDTHQRGLTLFHFKPPDRNSSSYKKFMENVNTVKLEETCGQEKEKCVSKVQKLFTDGKESSRGDLITTIVNFLVVSDCCVDIGLHQTQEPESSIGKICYSFADMIQDQQFDEWIELGKEKGIVHILHSILAFLSNLLRAWVSLTRDIRLHAKITSETQTFVPCTTEKFQYLIKAGEEALAKYRHDMLFQTFTSVATVPPTFKVKEPENKNQFVPGGGRYKRQRTTPGGGGGNNGGNADADKLEGAFVVMASAQSNAWPFVPTMPDGSKLCKFTILAHKSCNNSNCSFRHPVIDQLKKEECEMFNKVWQNKYRYKLTSAFARRVQTLGCDMNGSSNNPSRRNGNSNRNTNTNGSDSNQNNTSAQAGTDSNNSQSANETENANNTTSTDGPVPDE